MASLDKLRIVTLPLVFVALYSIAEAQVRREMPLIGILEPRLATNVCNDGLRQGLRDLGYVEGMCLYRPGMLSGTPISCGILLAN